MTRDFRDVVWSFHDHFVNSKYKVNKNGDEIDKRLKSSKNPYEFWTLIMNNDHVFESCKSYRIIWSYFHTVKTWLDENEKMRIKSLK